MLLLRFVLYIPITLVGLVILVARYGGWSRLRSVMRLESGSVSEVADATAPRPRAATDSAV
jgi:hypothetical protein